MLHKTKGIVLRVVKYGETSVIVSVFTELFGVQSYLVNGVRSTSKKGGNKASLFQAASILELVAYHNDLKNLQRLKEYKWAFLYRNILSDVPKNAVALFMIELVTKTLKQPEANPQLFYFLEDALHHLDDATEPITANFPLFFALHIPYFLGFSLDNSYSVKNNYLDLQEGSFTDHHPMHPNFIDGRDAEVVSEILKVRHPSELEQLKLNQDLRRRILFAVEQFYLFHVHDFGTMKTVPVLREIMS